MDQLEEVIVRSNNTIHALEELASFGYNEVWFGCECPIADLPSKLWASDGFIYAAPKRKDESGVWSALTKLSEKYAGNMFCGGNGFDKVDQTQRKPGFLLSGHFKLINGSWIDQSIV